MYKSSYELLKLLTCSIQIQTGRVFVVSSGLDLTDLGWVGVLDGIKAISAPTGLGLSLTIWSQKF